jgi:NTP pyrophosphatase (non-canonical NTP hydrolase)
MLPNNEKVFAEVDAEIASAIRKHGNQDDTPPLMWFAILSEEVGEVARAFCEIDHSRDVESYVAAQKNLREELVQVAAMAVRMVELGDRKSWW